jgi:holo-[acyl-carrier protein] synthase
MILGTGIDLIEISRIEASLLQFGERFSSRILRPEEVAYCHQFGRPAPHIAARFAAKEAASKAFGTGIGADLGWRDLEVARDAAGRPFLVLHGAARILQTRLQVSRIHLSLTHTAQYAAAVVTLEG